MALFELDHPFFNPLWVRIVITLACFSWGVFEFWTNSPFWGMLFFGIGFVTSWHFFLYPLFLLWKKRAIDK